LRGDAAGATQPLLLLQDVDVVVESDLGGGLIEEMPVDVPRRLRSLGPRGRTTDQQWTVNCRKAAEGQDPGERGNVEQGG